MDLHIPFHLGAHKGLDHGRVDVLLVLDVEGLLGTVDEVDDFLAGAPNTPDQIGDRWRREVLAVPVRLKATGNLSNLLVVVGHEAVVARETEVFRRPVERHDEGLFPVDDHRFLMGDRVLGIGFLHRDLRIVEELEGLVVVVFAREARGVEHHSDLDPPSVGRDDRLDQDGIGELEHLDVQGMLCRLHGLEDGGDPVVGLHDEAVDGVLKHGPVSMPLSLLAINGLSKRPLGEAPRFRSAKFRVFTCFAIDQRQDSVGESGA